MGQSGGYVCVVGLSVWSVSLFVSMSICLCGQYVYLVGLPVWSICLIGRSI